MVVIRLPFLFLHELIIGFLNYKWNCG